jgi:TorA maturation chaperone TorD
MSAGLQAEAMAMDEDTLRADCYRVLGRLFGAAPDAALLVSLAGAGSGGGDALGADWNALCALTTKVGAGDTAVAALNNEYTELFCGLGAPQVVLYGSWYLTGSLMDTPLAQLRDDLAQLGFARDPEVHEPEDHFAALMEVLAMLVAEGRVEQAAFFRRHVAPWYAGLCERLAQQEVSEFYRAAGRFARGFLDVERELMAA